MTTESRDLVTSRPATVGMRQVRNLEQVGSLGKDKPIEATIVEDQQRG